MKLNNKRYLKIYMFILCSIAVHAETYSTWGFFGHRKINLLATYTLPFPLHSFYRRHQKELQELAVLPDSRRYILDIEAARHYIDLDQYNLNQVSFSSSLAYSDCLFPFSSSLYTKRYLTNRQVICRVRSLCS
jgi:hypothetical protein